MGFFDLFKDEESEDLVENTEVAVDEDTEFASEASMSLREEEFDIHKDQVKTGEVVLNKEVVEEQKTVDVPVGHEQVVITRRTLDRSPSDEPITDEETIHIPVTAEQVDVEKHTVITEKFLHTNARFKKRSKFVKCFTKKWRMLKKMVTQK